MSEKKLVSLIEMLADVLQERDLSEIEVEDKEQRIRIAREQVKYSPVSPPPPSAVLSASTDSPTQSETVSTSENTVVSPIVGTIYLSPEPNAPEFIRVGDMVKQGQTLLIIEAMKVMNPISAPRSGKVTNIHVRDSEPVEFGAPLVDIE